MPEVNRILILGAGGMLGSAVYRFFSADDRFVTTGTLRSASKKRHFMPCEQDNLVAGIDVENESDLVNLFARARPDIVVNCVGVIKQLDASRNHLVSLALNTALPHRLAGYCRLGGARLVHISTDCVFDGSRGNYRESDFPDAGDLYGRTKYLGEVNYANAVTLRTSIIGHELESARSLISWFLSQTGCINGYKKAVFSGLPSIEIARIIRDFVLPNPELTGLYHLSATPIDKYALLSLVARIYGKEIDIMTDETVIIDRSLNSDRFRSATGFAPEPWPDLVSIMHENWVTHVAGDG